MNKNVFLSILIAALYLLAAPLFAADKSESDLIADLDSNNPLVQMSACKKLGEEKEKAAIGKLIELMENSADKRVAASAAAALGTIAEKGKSTEALYNTARGSKSTSVQYTSLLALANIDDSDYKEKTLELLGSIESSTGDDLLKDLAGNLKQRLEK